MSFFKRFLSWVKALFTAPAEVVSPQLPPPSELFRDPQLTKNFHIDEFACNDGTPVPAELYHNVLELAQNLQVLRDALGRPIKILDGYRTESYNVHIGGSPTSLHLEVRAADIMAGQDPHLVCAAAKAQIDSGNMRRGGLGLYPTFAHYDTRGRNNRWVDHE